MRRSFSPDIAKRMVGVTSLSQQRDGFYRHREVLAYLKRQGLERTQWVGIDDDPTHFPAGTPVIVVDPAHGFASDAAGRLLRAMQRD